MTTLYTNLNRDNLEDFVNENPRAYFNMIKCRNPELYAEIDVIVGKNFAEKTYIYIHGIQKCQRCSGPVTFYNIFDGYSEYCKDCYEENRKLKVEIGPPPKCAYSECNNPVIEHDKSGRWKEHCSLTCRGKHNSLKSRGKAQQTNMTKYGVPHHRMTPESYTNLQKTLKERYGVEHLSHIDGVADKIKKTNIEKYGTPCVLNNEDIKKKIIDTNIKRYGAPNPSQNKDIHLKKMRATKQYQITNGTIINVQGYEPQFLDLLGKTQEIKSDVIDVPEIKYVNGGKDRVYFPDLFIEEYNLLVEVKSHYTMSCDKSLIYDKILGSVCAGYNVLLVVIDNGSICSHMYYDQEIVLFMEETGYQDMMVRCGRTYSQYVNNSVSINFNHPYFSVEQMTSTVYMQRVIEDLRAAYDQVFMFDVSDVLTNFNVIKNMIRFKVGIGTVTYARKCETIIVSPQDAKDFLNKTHLSGFTPCSDYIGLTHQGQLVAIMCFSKPRLGVGKSRDNMYELVRFSSFGRVIGGASKLLKHFMCVNPGVDIISYSDNMYSGGGLYKTLGFELNNTVRPRFRYIKRGEVVLHHRFKYAKHKLKNMSSYDVLLSEHEIMLKEGFFRSYDAGKKTWIKKHQL